MFHWFFVTSAVSVASGLTMNASKEYQLRQYLFVTHPYDKNVGAIVSPHQSVKVRFSLRLSKVNTVVSIAVRSNWNIIFVIFQTETCLGNRRLFSWWEVRDWGRGKRGGVRGGGDLTPIHDPFVRREDKFVL